ncbi:MAG: hypothetical protein ACLP1Q_04155 [Solirubrobacteraceae bacterium]
MGGREVEQRETRVDNEVVRRAARRLNVALCVIAVACSLSAAISSAATRGWSPAVSVGGPRIQDLVFGPGNVPWVVFNDEPFYGSSPHPSAPQVARLTRRYALVDRRPIPSVPGYESSVRLYVNQSGVGAALSTLTPAGGGELAPPIGIGVSAWRPGKAPSQPVILTHNVREDEGASIAISASGTTAVSYATYETGAKFVVDRLTGGRVVSVHEVPIPSADIPISAEVLAASGGGFRAEWKLAGTMEGLAGIETTEVTADGVFSPDVFVPWPYEPGAPRVSQGIFRSDARGDEVAIWPTKEPPFREGVEPVTEWDLASKGAGGTWSSPQLIGTTGGEGANEMAVAIDPTGRFTVLWTSAQSRQMVVGGAAGAQASNPMPLQRRPTGLTERFQRLALTTTDHVVAIWNTYRDSRAEELTSVEAATSMDGVHFSKPQRISPNKRPMRGCLDELLVPDRAGGALAWWSCENDGHRVNEYARYRP